MKVLQVLIMAGLLTITSCDAPVKGKNGVVYKSALQYNDFIVSNQTKVYDYIFKLADAFNASDFDKAGKLIADAKPVAAEAITAVEGMPDWKGNHELRDAAVDLFKFYKSSFEKEYQFIVDIGLQEEAATPEQAKQLEKMVEDMSAAEKKYDNAMSAEQAAFAKANNMRLEPSKLQDKVDKLNDE